MKTLKNQNSPRKYLKGSRVRSIGSNTSTRISLSIHEIVKSIDQSLFLLISITFPVTLKDLKLSSMKFTLVKLNVKIRNKRYNKRIPVHYYSRPTEDTTNDKLNNKRVTPKIIKQKEIDLKSIHISLFSRNTQAKSEKVYSILQ